MKHSESVEKIRANPFGLSGFRQSPVFRTSIIVVVIYLFFSFLAFTHYPGAYAPWTHWLSDLGSFQQNPAGAVYYSIGMIAGGLALLFFFLFLSSLAMPENKIQRLMLMLTRVFGSVGAIAMMLIAIFPINTATVHSSISEAFFILTGTAFTFSIAAFRYIPSFHRWVLGIGLLTVVVNLLWCLVLNVPIVQWITIGLFLGYILLIGTAALRISQYAAK